jgi:hypothetical protein
MSVLDRSNAFDTLLNSLTLEDAKAWDSLTDKWVFVDDHILAPAGMLANDRRVNAIEDRFMSILEMVKL